MIKNFEPQYCLEHAIVVCTCDQEQLFAQRLTQNNNVIHYV